MTDPTFETWEGQLICEIVSLFKAYARGVEQRFGLNPMEAENASFIFEQQIRAAHAHLMPKGHDDAK